MPIVVPRSPEINCHRPIVEDSISNSPSPPGNANNTDSESSSSANNSLRKSPPRPTHLPLDSLHLKLIDNKTKKPYYRNRPRQDEPIIVQNPLITFKSQRTKENYDASRQSSFKSTTPNDSSSKAREHLNQPLLKKTGLSQSHGNDLDLSPRTPSGPHLPTFTFKEAIASPTTPTAPFTTPVKEVSETRILPSNLSGRSDPQDEEEEYIETPLPVIPNLNLLPSYLDQNYSGSQEMVRCCNAVLIL